jgi:hypothetical protein
LICVVGSGVEKWLLVFVGFVVVGWL